MRAIAAPCFWQTNYTEPADGPILAYKQMLWLGGWVARYTLFQEPQKVASAARAAAKRPAKLLQAPAATSNEQRTGRIAGCAV